MTHLAGAKRWPGRSERQIRDRQRGQLVEAIEGKIRRLLSKAGDEEREQGVIRSFISWEFQMDWNRKPWDDGPLLGCHTNWEGWSLCRCTRKQAAGSGDILKRNSTKKGRRQRSI